MAITERIQEYIQELPETFQKEALDFIEYLWKKSKNGTVRQEEDTWSRFSLISAMRSMEDEDTPVYTVSDLKYVF